MPAQYNVRNGLRQQYLKKSLMTTNQSDNTGLLPYQKENVKKWTTYYRRNWEIYARDVFGLTLYPIQAMKIHMMGISDTYFDISTRGTAKSFDVGVGALCAFSLYPYSEIVITASIIRSSNI